MFRFAFVFYVLCFFASVRGSENSEIINSFNDFYLNQFKEQDAALEALVVYATVVNLIFDNYFDGFSKAEKEQFVKRSKELTLVAKQKLLNQKDILRPDDVMYLLLKFLVSELDSHSNIINNKEYRQIQKSVSNKNIGIGAEVKKNQSNNNAVEIISILPNSPADRLGLDIGDIIISVDGVKVDEKSDSAINAMLNNSHKSKIHVRAYSNRLGNVNEFLIKIGVIDSKVFGEILIEDKYLYLSIKHFNNETAYNVEKAIKENQGKTKGVIIDLRGNLGGLLNQALSVANMLLKDDVIVSLKGQNVKDNIVYKSEKKRILRDDIPVIVIVNNFSASASEVLSMALQDNKRATILGQKTFGKGSVQTIFEINKDLVLKLTTKLYYGPKDQSVEYLGLTPDIYLLGGGASLRRNKDDKIYKHIKAHKSKKSNITINSLSCTPYGRDYELGCALLFLNNELDYDKFKSKLKH